ncbi:MAG: hypothetical protein AAFV86_19085, partial [Pseudomonadota bacterium]
FQQERRHVVGRRRHQDAVEGRLLGPAARPVACAQRHVGDVERGQALARGWPEQAPFDRILVAAAADDVPALLLEQLRPGGILVLPVGETDEVQTLLRIERTPDGLDYRELAEVLFVPLVEGLPDDERRS